MLGVDRTEQAMKAVVLIARFRHALAVDRRFRDVLCRVLRHPEVRAVVRDIIREEIRA
jgi:hypothetical protein